ncbi:MAG: TlyA family RNA methyltransferase [Puniceicoccales bacterium]|nr:TlyA family RNA methyltransferase [Puniceicoccales bacterium]
MEKRTGRIRADELLVLQDKATSRALAKALIMAGKVRCGPDNVVTKPAALLPIDAPLSVVQGPRFVSRGGEKLSHALAHFGITVAGDHGLDVGASTGGFTDCLLQEGAVSVVCVDVGHGQLHQKLRADSRVTNFEKVNARALKTLSLPRENYDIVVMDLAFISLTKVLAPAWARVGPGGRLVALVKPQFEAEKAEVDKGGGIIRDSAIHMRVVGSIRDFIRQNLAGATILGVVDSPITGGDGNREFLIALARKAPVA